MSPADELRQAAAKVRETAKEALSGFMSELPADWIAFYRRREDNGTLDRDDVAWINLMHPGLAEPLARLLDAAAQEIGMESYDCDEGCDSCGGHEWPVHNSGSGLWCEMPINLHGKPGDWCTCPHIGWALTFARLINGGAS